MNRKSKSRQMWWKRDQMSNLAALYTSLSEDLSNYLPAAEDVVGEYTPVNVQVAAAVLQQSSLLKKYEYEAPAEANAKALEKFLQVNEACGKYTLKVESDEDNLLVGELKSALHRFFFHGSTAIIETLSQVLDFGKVGPGTSIGANGNDFYSKLFSSCLSTTSKGLYIAYRSYIETLPNWQDADDYRLDAYGDIEIVRGNKLTFVPKNVDISRTICIEPSLNMFFQLGVKQILERRIERLFGVDFAVQQEKNRDLAQLASMFDGQWSTIDLSSASDSMSNLMLEQVLPREFFAWLQLFRSPEMTLPDGSQLKLNMVSTMGNGFTFPLQTLLFLCVVYSAHKVAGLPFLRPYGRKLGNFGVYGDDIICRSEVTPKVLRLLELLGFNVNADKSFFQGPFRESCGGDFYKGHHVRAVYIKRLLCTQDAYVAINMLNQWTARVGIYLPKTVHFLIGLVQRAERPLLVPIYENSDAGLRCYRRHLENIVLDPHVRSIKYRRHAIKGRNITFREDGCILAPEGLGEKLVYNSSGLLVSLLSGAITGGKIAVRHNFPIYRTESRIAPFWDYEGGLADFASAYYCMPLGKAVSINTGL